MAQSAPPSASAPSASVSAASAAAADQAYTSGLIAAAIAFVIWGVFPLYLGLISKVPAIETTAHRIAWSFVFVLGWLAVRGELGQIGDAVRRGVTPRLALSAALITINWLAFVWGANSGHVVEISLGYYINPLVNVLLGVVLLNERLNRAQWIGVALAAAGVVYLTIGIGHLPWIAITVAISFAFYGFIRKTAKVDALPGLGIEMMILAPFAIGYLVWREMNGIGALGHSATHINWLLAFSGVATAVPLYLYAFGARRVPYSTIGVIQYIGPSMQLMCAVLFFHETFDKARAIGFAFIWLALIVYAADGFVRSRTQRLAPAT